jgi:hypothetical protein
LSASSLAGSSKSVNIPPLAAAGGFLEEYGWAIGLVAALLVFFTGWRPFGK